MTVILVTRLNGRAFSLNPDLIERAEGTPDTVVTLVDGTKYVVSESVREIMTRVREYRAAVIATAGELERAAVYAEPQRRGNVVALPTREA
jgi:flagellar protein FlbD